MPSRFAALRSPGRANVDVMVRGYGSAGETTEKFGKRRVRRQSNDFRGARRVVSKDGVSVRIAHENQR